MLALLPEEEFTTLEIAGVIYLWIFNVALAVCGAVVISKERLQLTKSRPLPRKVAIAIGWTMLLIGVLCAIGTWPPLILH
jgi:hypothetical protein